MIDDDDSELLISGLLVFSSLALSIIQVFIRAFLNTLLLRGAEIDVYARPALLTTDFP